MAPVEQASFHFDHALQSPSRSDNAAYQRIFHRADRLQRISNLVLELFEFLRVLSGCKRPLGKKPVAQRLLDETCLPSNVRGPVDCCAFLRFASTRLMLASMMVPPSLLLRPERVASERAF